jgi:hypothetical protein
MRRQRPWCNAFGVNDPEYLVPQGIRLRRKPWAKGCNAFGVQSYDV